MAPSKGERFTDRLEQLEEENLEQYALKSRSRRVQLGPRLFREGKVGARLEYRTEYHRDRDRIVWSKSFKRLQNKTQVFPHYVEDHYKRRLTHSLEVTQIATTVARALRINEVATEAIARGHDLGHTPFGHAGEEALNEILKDKCKDHNIDPAKCPVPIFGFDHCVHAIEVVSRIEQEYGHETGHGGLNLTFDVRDGILKHMFDRNPDPEKPLSTVSGAVKPQEYRVFGDNKGSLEAQCVYFADKLAYLLGDIEDGLRSDILRCPDIRKEDFYDALQDYYAKYRKKASKIELVSKDSFPGFRSKVLTVLILDCIDNALANLRRHAFPTVQDVLSHRKRIVWVGDRLAKAIRDFYDKWVVRHMFVHNDVVACAFKAKNIVRDLFDAYYGNERLINEHYRQHCKEAYKDVCKSDSDPVFRLILVRNYVAGMTDSYATQQHARLFMSSERISV